MTETQTLKKLKRAHWRSIEALLKQAYRHGFEVRVVHKRSRRAVPAQDQLVKYRIPS